MLPHPRKARHARVNVRQPPKHPDSAQLNHPPAAREQPQRIGRLCVPASAAIAAAARFRLRRRGLPHSTPGGPKP